MNIIDRAAEFAKRAHGEQLRKYTGEPYWHHLRNVAEIVASVPHVRDPMHSIFPESAFIIEGMRVAAWLHDTVEDTATTLDEIGWEFGHHIQSLVYWLTDASRPEDGNRETRKLIDLRHLAIAPAEAQTIKLADLIDNTASIVERDKNFARVYLAEKEALLEVLVKGNGLLRKRAYETLRKGQRALVQDALAKAEGA